MNLDKAGRPYWERLWAERLPTSGPKSVEYLQMRFRRFLWTVFCEFETKGNRLLEAGCGPSLRLSSLAGEFGFQVTGIDYSPKACELARVNLLQHGNPGEVVCADLFDPPEDMKESFDVVFSAGLVEHFTETATCLQSLANFLKPGGLMITSVPNLTGICGWIQKAFNHLVFDMHVPLDTRTLAKAHEDAGLEVIACDYFMSTNFGIINLEGLARNSVGFLSKNVVLALLRRLSQLSWLLEDHLRPIPANRFSSPYVNCIARKSQYSHTSVVDVSYASESQNL